MCIVQSLCLRFSNLICGSAIHDVNGGERELTPNLWTVKFRPADVNYCVEMMWLKCPLLNCN